METLKINTDIKAKVKPEGLKRLKEYIADGQNKYCVNMISKPSREEPLEFYDVSVTFQYRGWSSDSACASLTGLLRELQDVTREGSFREYQNCLQRSVSYLNLSVRSTNCMARLGIKTLGDLVSKTPRELLRVQNFGIISLNEVREKLNCRYLTLTDDR